MTPLSPRARLVGLLAVGLGTALAPLDTSVNVAFPFITAAFQQPIDAIQWVVICYVLTYSSLMLVCGRLGDLFGHRRIFLIGLLLSAAAFVLCAIAASFAWLLAFRVLQGVGSALVLSCSVALATQLYPESERARAIAVYTMIFGFGTMLGPVIGGLVVEAWGWSGVFWFRLPLALFSAVLMIKLPAAVHEDRGERFDFVGACLLALGVSSALLALNRFQDANAGWVVGAILLATSIVTLILYGWRQARIPAPILSLTMFRSPEFTLLNLANCAVMMASFSVFLLVPFYLAQIAGHSALSLGMVVALAPVGFVIGSPLAAKLSTAVAPRRLCLAGACTVAAGLWFVAQWDQSTDWAGMALPLLAAGLGHGIFQSTYTGIVVGSLPLEQRGVAGGLALLTRTIGTVAGATTWMAVFTHQRLGSGFEAGFQTTFEIVAVALVLFLIATMIRPRTWLGRGA